MIVSLKMVDMAILNKIIGIIIVILIIYILSTEIIFEYSVLTKKYEDISQLKSHASQFL